MTNASFLVKNGELYGFHLEGHSTNDAGDDEGRALCAAVSSAAYMAANTITEIAGDTAAVEIGEGTMSFEVSSPSDKTKVILEGLRLHLRELSKQYGTRLNITEV